MITTSETTKAIGGALLKFQGYVSGVKRDGKNPHFKSRYATLENVFDTARPGLQDVGIAVVQAPCSIVEGSLEITTRLIHAESGEWMQSTMHMPLGKRDPQGAGSATTYGLRYSLMAMLGLPPTDDDDGNYASLPKRDEPSAAYAHEGMERQAGDPSPKTSAQLKRDGVFDEFKSELLECETFVMLEKFKAIWREKIRNDGWPDAWKHSAKDLIEGRENDIMRAMDDAELAEVPLKTALKQSIKRDADDPRTSPSNNILAGG